MEHERRLTVEHDLVVRSAEVDLARLVRALRNGFPHAFSELQDGLAAFCRLRRPHDHCCAEFLEPWRSGRAHSGVKQLTYCRISALTWEDSAHSVMLGLIVTDRVETLKKRSLFVTESSRRLERRHANAFAGLERAFRRSLSPTKMQTEQGSVQNDERRGRQSAEHHTLFGLDEATMKLGAVRSVVSEWLVAVLMRMVGDATSL